MKYKCYTIGHSTHEIVFFIHLLKKYSINCLIDVRSVPYSQYAPAFNREFLKNELEDVKIIYQHFDKEFGAQRIEKKLLFKDGKVNFEKVLKTIEFQKGIQRIKKGLKKGYNIAIMCAEKDPFDCHRFVLVSRGLELNKIKVQHILGDGSLISNNKLEDKLVKKYKIQYNQFQMFNKTNSYTEAVETGYKKRNLDIAYSDNNK